VACFEQFLGVYVTGATFRNGKDGRYLPLRRSLFAAGESGKMEKITAPGKEAPAKHAII
jgi:hypothetical protein